MSEQLTWKLVDDTAAELGASKEARLKWRQEGRGVPPAWRIQIAEALSARDCQIPLAAFDELTAKPGRIAA